MLMDEHMIKIILTVVVAVFLLLQWFLSTRPWFIWGLALPLMFGGIWYLMANPLSFLPFESLFGEEAIAYFIRVSRTGVLLSVPLFVLCRVVMLIKRGVKK